MISHNKVTVISLLMIFAALVFVVFTLLNPPADENAAIQTVNYSDLHSISYSSEDNSTEVYTGAKKIVLDGTTAYSESKNVTVSANRITVIGAGTYIVSGELSDGSLIIDSSDNAPIRLVLDNAHISSTDHSAIHVKQAHKVIISLADGTENSLSDGSTYSSELFSDSMPSAALHSSDDLVINGTGSLSVNGNFKDAIKANDSLKITDAYITINAADDGINVNDHLSIRNSKIKITAAEDAVKCQNDDNALGFVALNDSSLDITCSGDGIDASSAVYSDNCNISISTDGTKSSSKGIKAAENIQLTNGKYEINSADDSVHSDGSISVSDGEFIIYSQNDAFHAEKDITLAPQMIDIQKCFEGIEGTTVLISSGEISIVSSDDAINAAGASGNSFMPVRQANGVYEDIGVSINGGNIRIVTSGDGVDSNGTIYMNGGDLAVYGPESSANSSLDSEYGFIINGGTLIAAGSSGMAESPSDYSEQNSLIFYLDKSFEKGSEISLHGSSDNKIISDISEKDFDWVCISSNNIIKDEQYSLMINGTEISTCTVSDTVTVSGNSRGNIWRR